MDPLFLWIRIIGALGPLSYASISDFRTRMVEHEWTWLIMIFTGSIIAIFEALAFHDLRILLDLAINVGLSITIAFLLFYAGLFGGADGKALISLSFLFPRPPLVFLEWGFKPLLPFFFLTILSNALLLTAVIPVAILVRNILDYASARANEKDPLFLGLECEPLWKKVLTLLIGIRMDYPPPPHFYSLVELVEVDGMRTPRLNLFRKVEDEKDTNLQKMFEDYLNKFNEPKIWVSPGIPFIIPITLGLIVTLTVGDLILLILNSLIP